LWHTTTKCLHVLIFQGEVTIAAVHQAKVKMVAILDSTRIVLLFFVFRGVILQAAKIHGQPEKRIHLGLLVKVSTNDEVTAVNDSDFIATVYSNTTYSVVTHLNECSSGRAPKLIPYQRNSSLQLDSVLSVNLPGSSASYNRTTLFLAAKEDVEEQLQLNHGVGLGDAVDFVIFCVPSGLSGPTFLASGAFDSFWIVAKISACTNPTILLHELGHVYGLKHANQGNVEYGDETSLMGLSSVSKGNRCFNGHNLWKLKWFQKDYATEVVLNTETLPSATLELATFLDVSKVSYGQQVVLVKVFDLYLVYNRQKLYNRDTGDFPDMVTIVRELETQDSDLLAGLNENRGNDIFRYRRKDEQSVTIQICKRLDGDETNTDRFQVAIGYDDFPCTSSNPIDYQLSSVPTVVPSSVPVVALSIPQYKHTPTLPPSTIQLPYVISKPSLTRQPTGPSTPTLRPQSRLNNSPLQLPIAPAPIVRYDKTLASKFTPAPFPFIQRNNDPETTPSNDKLALIVISTTVMLLIIISFICICRRKTQPP
jgi:Gametolysin peptidase M11